MIKTIDFIYKFRFNKGLEKIFKLTIDEETLYLIQEEKDTYPQWTLLNNQKCPHCYLNEKVVQYCPIAKNLVEPIDFFKNSLSYEELDIYVETKTRNYHKKTSLQKGLSSLIGIYMTTSGCPIMEKIKPMVRFHLPFATLEETKFRMMSMYLLAQYLLYIKNKQPDWNMNNLVKIYADIKKVNEYFCKRLASIVQHDANTNAIIILNCFAESVLFSIDKYIWEELERFFKPYLEEK